MFLSFLIFLPLSVFPTLFFLKKDFQVRAVLFATALIHMFFSIGLISKTGYKFIGLKQIESWPIFKSIGFSYQIGVDAQSLLVTSLMSIFFFVFTLFCVKRVSKKDVYLMLIAQACFLGAVLAQNLFLFIVFLEIGFFSVLALGSFKKEVVSGALFLNLSGVALFLCTTTVFSILYESIYAFPSLYLKALASMSTPFIKGSFFSTQTVLFLSFSLSFFFNILTALYLIKNTDKKSQILKTTQIMFFFVTLLFGLVKFAGPLFPEVSSVYIPFDQTLRLEIFKISVAFFFVLYVTKALMLARKEVI